MIRTRGFLRAYRLLPHGMINATAARVARLARPRALVRAAVREWIRRDGIDMRPFRTEEWRSLEHFFLRRLAPGARPIGEALTSPVDGRVVGAGSIAAGTMLQVKGRDLSVARVLGESAERLEGGQYVTLFLRPKGYHYVHAPADAIITGVRWIPGRFFPQNEDALEHIGGVYERNERAVLTTDAGWSLVMVGASVVGGIHVRGIDVRAGGPLRRPVKKGDEIGHFTFGSTVILLFPPEHRARVDVRLGEDVLMGQTIGSIR